MQPGNAVPDPPKKADNQTGWDQIEATIRRLELEEKSAMQDMFKTPVKKRSYSMR